MLHAPPSLASLSLSVLRDVREMLPPTPYRSISAAVAASPATAAALIERHRDIGEALIAWCGTTEQARDCERPSGNMALAARTVGATPSPKLPSTARAVMGDTHRNWLCSFDRANTM